METTMELNAIEVEIDKCPLCGSCSLPLNKHFHSKAEADLLFAIQKVLPGWSQEDGICSRCTDECRFEVEAMHKSMDKLKMKHLFNFDLDFLVLPIPVRVDANTDYTGKGVTICFIDSGFYPHPDLVSNKNRIKKIIDITNTKNTLDNYFSKPHNESWHGTMTSVVCAGDGFLSGGLYKGIASDAELVLLKVQDSEGKITGENIIKALEWVNKNHKKYGIKIVNLSISDDFAESFKTNLVSKKAEELVRKNILLVAAVGNDEHAEILPPASSPNIIAVGGVDDHNKLDDFVEPYHSSYGLTIDHIKKPELVTNAIWIPTPILPDSFEMKNAAILFELLHEKNNFHQLLEDNYKKLGWSNYIQMMSEDAVKNEIKKIIWDKKYLTKHYQHSDGTSFAAPIVCSVAAQLLEINPKLTVAQLRAILFNTAKKLPAFPEEKQGFGAVNPKKAIYEVLEKELIDIPLEIPAINLKEEKIVFFTFIPNAKTVSLAGDFNNWKADEVILQPFKDDVWKVELPLLPKGEYVYKFCIDNQWWKEDSSNPYKVEDNYGGWNSVFKIN